MKAILVVDIPDGIFIDDCKIEYRVIENVFNMCVADGIKRLKPMPETKDVGYPNDDYDVGFGDGWDDCLKEITGETE